MHDQEQSAAAEPDDEGSNRGRLAEIARLFLRFGFTAFGGPAAHMGMYEDEVVTRRKWMTRQHFLDLVGATNLIPGPNSTEMTMHIGYERGGVPGLFVAGLCFTVPALLITGTLGWFYVRFGSLPEVGPFLAGTKPAVLVIILTAVWRLGRKSIKNRRTAILGLLVGAAVLAGVNEVLALFAGGFGGMLWFRIGRRPAPGERCGFMPLAVAGAVQGVGAATGAIVPVSLWKLGFFFLKVGSILYGTGYVLVAFLEGDLVQRYGWLTQGQLLDAIAAGQLTPGPLFATAAFVGYVLMGVPGAVVAGLGIFLPSFLFVLVLNPVIPRLRQSPWTAAFLDSVNVAAVALMAAVGVRLSGVVLASWQAVAIAMCAGIALLRFKFSSAWLIVGGAALGYLLKLI